MGAVRPHSYTWLSDYLSVNFCRDVAYPSTGRAPWRWGILHYVVARRCCSCRKHANPLPARHLQGLCLPPSAAVDSLTVADILLGAFAQVALLHADMDGCVVFDTFWVAVQLVDQALSVLRSPWITTPIDCRCVDTHGNVIYRLVDTCPPSTVLGLLRQVVVVHHGSHQGASTGCHMIICFSAPSRLCGCCV